MLQLVNIHKSYPAGDGSVEGLEYKNIPAFSVQFTPDTDEIAAGTGFLYQKFLQKMTK